MFNPIKVVLPPIQEKPLVEEATLEKAYASFSTGLFDVVRDSHAKMIETQKSLFKNLRDKMEDADEYAYRIITTKYETYSETIFDYLYDKAIEAMKLFYKNVPQSDQQVRILKAAIKHDQALGFRQYAPNSNIGFVTIPLPSQKDLAKAFGGFGQAWSNMEPMDRVEEFHKLPEWFKSESSIWDHMDERLDIRFKKDLSYPLSDIIAYYDKFKEGVKSCLDSNRKQTADLKAFIKKIHDKNAVNFQSYIKQVNELNLSKEEKDVMLNIASNNYSLLSDIYTVIINGICTYNHCLGGYIYRSLIAYKELIQLIYSQVYEEKEDTKHGFLPRL